MLGAAVLGIGIGILVGSTSETEQQADGQSYIGNAAPGTVGVAFGIPRPAGRFGAPAPRAQRRRAW